MKPHYSHDIRSKQWGQVNGKLIIDGKQVLRGWESWSGWYWFTVEEVQQQDTVLDVTVIKNDTEISGSSIMGLMMLAAAPGCELELRARGPAASAAVVALADLIASRFEEDG